MVQFRTFPKAPITEAVLDISVALPNDFDIKNFMPFHDAIRDRFEKRQERRMVVGQLKFSPECIEPVEQQKSSLQGYLFSSEAEKKIIQFRIDGFTFNKLKPYENWENFRDEGKQFWENYREIAVPTKIQRISLRYINRIELPLPFDDFGEYIQTNPQIAPSLPQSVAGFFMRIEVPNPDIGAIAIINEKMEPPSPDGKLPIILDIDVLKKHQYATDQEMWEDFEKLRNFKNDIFFNSITEKAAELFI